jgi:hypothetical protein
LTLSKTPWHLFSVQRLGRTVHEWGIALWARLLVRASSLRREWVPTVSDARERMATVALFAIVGLVGAPIAQMLSDQCRLCPPTCPMHHVTRAPEKRGCHAGTSTGHETTSHHQNGQRLTRPPCGHTAQLPAVGVGPMVLNDGNGQIIAPIVRTAPDSLDAERSRLGEPPDTPPPIFSA